MAELQELKKILKSWEIEFYREQKRKPTKGDIEAAPEQIQVAYSKYGKLRKSSHDTNLPGTVTKVGKPRTASAGDESVPNRSLSTESGEGLQQSRGSTGSDHSADAFCEDPDTEKDVWGKKFDRKSEKPAAKERGPSQKQTSSFSFLQNMGSRLFQNSQKIGNTTSNKVPAVTYGLQTSFSSQQKVKAKWERTLPKPNTEDRDCFAEAATKASKCSEIQDKSSSDADLSLNTVAMKQGSFFEKAKQIAHPKVLQTSNKDEVYLPTLLKARNRSRMSLPSHVVSQIDEYSKSQKFEDEIKADIDCETNDFGNFRPRDLDIDVNLRKSSPERGGFDPNDTVGDNVRDIGWESESFHEADKSSDIGTTNSDSSKQKQSFSKVKKKEYTPFKKSVTTALIENLAEHSKSPDRTDSQSDVFANKPKRLRGLDVIDVKIPALTKPVDPISTEHNIPLEPKVFDFDDGSDKEESDDNKTTRKRKKALGASGQKTKKRRVEKTGNNSNLQGADYGGDPGERTTSTVASKPAGRKKAAVSNENFVRLNMKVKKYNKKGKSMSGPAYKRMQWKQKMKARSESYGDKCFKCGQPGHWANKCKNAKSSFGGPSNTEPVTEEDFPSMKEAAMMARGIKSSDKQPAAVTAGKVEEQADDLDVDLEVVRTRREAAESLLPPMEPLFSVGENEQLPATPKTVLNGLKKFGFEDFRPGQEEAIMRVLCGLSTLVVLSTGGGKSLCYKLPAFLYAQRSNCITLVISPLVSLMEDQIAGLPPGVKGACLHTNMTASQRESVTSDVKEGKVHFLLLSPEAIAGGSMSLLSLKSALPPVSFVCIDEVHCLSEWSHNFRPSYLRLCKVLREKFGIQCFLGLTATATLSTAEDVSRHLGITDFRKATIRGSPVPTNLLLSVSRDMNREQSLLGLLQGERFSNCQSIIIYCTRRDQTDRVATLIRTSLRQEKDDEDIPKTKKGTKKKGRQRDRLVWDAESYHAGLTAAKRKSVQNAFMSGRLRVVVATVAFGMGLDKSDVRGVIHYNMPKSFESYVQEIGRAGRDGEPAHCHVFLDSEGKDLSELRKHTYANTVDYRTLRKLIQKVFVPCRCREIHERHTKALEECCFNDGDDMALVTSADALSGAEHAIDPHAAALQVKENTETSTNDDVLPRLSRVCPGHERALSIEQTVNDLDIKEEGISTLLCYLELHHSMWVESLSNVYATCKIQCYGGPAQLQTIAKKCPPVAVAIAKAKKDGQSFASSNSLDFSVVDISDTMGWESGPVKRELKCLQWTFGNSGPTKTGVMVEFSDLAFHFRCPGDLTDEELDDVLQFLHERVQRQEKAEIGGLTLLSRSLTSVSHKNYWMCADDLDMQKNDRLKAILNKYFESQGAELQGDNSNSMEPELDARDLSHLVSDIRAFISVYGHEFSLNGRTIARIFHGIGSPCFPATTWGRVRRYWRSHINSDFNQLVKMATQELLRMRS